MILTHSQREAIWWATYAKERGESAQTESKLMHYTQLCGAEARYEQREAAA